MFRIANGQGFWGDLPQAPRKQVQGGSIDVLSLEYLAEVTLGILARMEQNDPSKGYVPDVVEHLKPILSKCLKENITIVTSAGGLNPVGCAEEIKKILLDSPLTADIAVVKGDECTAELHEWLEDEELRDETETFLKNHKDDILTANRYLGSKGIAQAITEGADVVITGRVTDTALVLGPAIAKHGWSLSNYDRLARGIVAGHLLECGGQVTGGNFSGDWDSIPDLWDLGFPIAELGQDGTVTITKHESQGGKVTRETVSEQLVYELTSPSEYLTPDVTVDFSSIKLDETGQNRVTVSGVVGSAPPETDKISVLVQTGYQISGHITYCGPRPIKKAKKAEELLRKRLEQLELTPQSLEVESVGYNACHGELSQADANQQDEVVFRIAGSDSDKNKLKKVGEQLMGLILTGPPGATGFSEGRPRPKPVIEHRDVYRERNQTQKVEFV